LLIVDSRKHHHNVCLNFNIAKEYIETAENTNRYLSELAALVDKTLSINP
jgi:hypothetical protein